MQRPRDAEEQFAKAIQTCFDYFPNSLLYAQCLFKLEISYADMGRKPEAVESLETARQLYEKMGTQADLDNCDQFLGFLQD